MFKFFKVPVPPEGDFEKMSGKENKLQQYIQSCSMEDLSRWSQDISPEVRHLITMNVHALLGYLPASEFNTTIVSSKENFQHLIASAMFTGYFLHAMEQRMAMDSLFSKDPAQNNHAEENATAEETPVSVEKTPDNQKNLSAYFEQLIQKAKQYQSQSEGSFLTPEELQSQAEPKKDVQLHLEINTQMDLETFLNEFQFLKKFQSKQED